MAIGASERHSGPRRSVFQRGWADRVRLIANHVYVAVRMARALVVAARLRRAQQCSGDDRPVLKVHLMFGK